MQSPNLQEFVDRLMAEKGYRTLTLEAEASMKQELLQLVDDKINATIVARIPDDQQEAFGQLIDAGNEQEIQDFIIEQIPNLQEVLAAALLDLRRTFLA